MQIITLMNVIVVDSLTNPYYLALVRADRR